MHADHPMPSQQLRHLQIERVGGKVGALRGREAQAGNDCPDASPDALAYFKCIAHYVRKTGADALGLLADPAD